MYGCVEVDVAVELSLGVVSWVGHKTADWICMPFGVVNGVGPGMGVLDGSGDH